MKSWRIIAVAVIDDGNGRYLICKKPADRGVFAGMWALPGGGIEEGERMEDALRREVREEVGLEVHNIRPALFKDGGYPKFFTDGTVLEIYMIFLVFTCTADQLTVNLGEEFETHHWALPDELNSYALNEQTRMTFEQLGILEIA